MHFGYTTCRKGQDQEPARHGYMKPIDLTLAIKDFQDKWVALSEDERTVCGAGDTAQAAILDAESEGYKDYVLFFVRPFNLLCA